MAGQTLSRYKVLEKLGSKSIDSASKSKNIRRDRTVAIEVIPTHLSSDPRRRLRFESEIRIASSLNHLNKCTFHDLDAQGDVDFLIVDYLSGETLADRLKKRTSSPNVAHRYAAIIADALGHAFRPAVVNRDLKPANIMPTNPGREANGLRFD